MRFPWSRKAARMIRYVTDGERLFEVVGVVIDKNAGVMRGMTRSYKIRPLVDLDEESIAFTVNEAVFSKMTPVDPDDELSIAELYRDLEGWEVAPPWWA